MIVSTKIKKASSLYSILNVYIKLGVGLVLLVFIENQATYIFIFLIAKQR